MVLGRRPLERGRDGLLPHGFLNGPVPAGGADPAAPPSWVRPLHDVGVVVPGRGHPSPQHPRAASDEAAGPDATAAALVAVLSAPDGRYELHDTISLRTGNTFIPDFFFLVY